MSLDWNISKCENWEELKDEEHWPVTNALIWATMQVDLGEISEKNLDEFFTRLKMAEEVYGPLLFTWEKDQPKESLLTYGAVKRRIGLYTNVSNKTPNQFNKRIAEVLRRHAEDVLRYEKGVEAREQRNAA